METENTRGGVGFNPTVFGTAGWSKFSVPMIAGTKASQMAEFNAALDNLIAVAKKYGTGANPTYLAAFNVEAVYLHTLGGLIIDGKPTI